MIINGKEGGGGAFAMEIPMDAFGHFADEVKHQIRDFQVSLEITEIECMLAMYEKRRIHGVCTSTLCPYLLLFS